MCTQELVVDPSAISVLPESIMIYIMSLNADLLWHKLVCRAARDAFSTPTQVSASSATLPLWALDLMLRTNTTIQQRMKVASGRAIAADIPGLALLKASAASDVELQHTFGPPVYAATAKAGHISVLQWLQAARKGRGIRDWDHTVCTAAAGAGKLDVLQWLRSQEPRCAWSSVHVWEGAAASGNIEMLQWLKDQQCPGLDSSSICTAAAAAGQVAVLDWMYQQLTILPLEEAVFNAAGAGGHYNVLLWLKQLPESAELITLGSTDCAAAAAGGHLAVLRFLREEIIPPASMSSASCVAAAKGGHLEVLRYVRAQGCPWSPAVCAAAAGGQQLHVLQWLRSQHPPCPWDFHTCKAAAQAGHLNLLKWLRAQTDPCPFHKSVMLEAVEACQLEVVKWLVTCGCPYDRWIDTLAYSMITYGCSVYASASHGTKKWAELYEYLRELCANYECSSAV